MAYKQVRLGEYFKFEKGLGYKGEFLAEESDIAMIGMDSHNDGGGYKDNSEKPYSGPYKPEHVAEVGDVIFAATEQGFGLLASPLMVPDSDKFQTFIFSHHVLKAFPVKDGFLPEYLYNIFRVDRFRAKAAYGDTGTTVRALPAEVLEELLVPLPDLATQQAINEIIAIIDQQIANNKALSKSLETLAQAMFKSWFIDFDPVLAKSKGEMPYGMDDATASLFPSKFQDLGTETIPVGWEIVPLGEYAQVVVGGTPSRAKNEYWGGSIPWVNSGKINEFRVVEPSELITDLGLRKSAAKLMPAGTTLIAMTGATLGQFSRLEIQAAGTQNVIGVSESDLLSNEFIYMTVANNMRRIVSAGTGGAQQHINKAVIQDLEIIFPGVELVKIYTRLSKPIFERIAIASFQNVKLRELGHSLLPELTSGDLREIKNVVMS